MMRTFFITIVVYSSNVLFELHTNNLTAFAARACHGQQEEEQDHQEEAIVTVADIGSSIIPEMFPRLFTKFSSKSFSGTGLIVYF
ncbi:MAG: hypothetical protein WBZ36_15925 [Candidatus Nitrosopolaris sp.]